MRFFLSISLILSIQLLNAQRTKSSSEILHELKKLQNSTTVLYLAAHPDDENTRMISWLVNGYGARTAYMSLTRGDGGQNLIGTELGAKLGILRTQELMQARKIDGGEQFFSRAVDFGYSKTADETLNKWGDEVVLNDVVWVIRNFRPDVIITRFPPDERAGHGHHTASAMLGIKAFNLAADKKVFPRQLEYTKTWKPKRIYWNASVWWNRKLDSLAKVDDNYVSVEVGGYNSLQGRSYNELASLSRTQHKSQGFGVSVARGQQMEYLEYLAGDKAEGDLFEDISSKWERFGFTEGDKMLKNIIGGFNSEHPEASIKDLFELRDAASAINDDSKRKYFTNKVEEVISLCLGLHIEAISSREFVIPNSLVKAKVEVLARDFTNNTSCVIKEINVAGVSQITRSNNEIIQLTPNAIQQEEVEFKVTSLSSQPYWLQSPYQNLFKVDNPVLIGKPENDPTIFINVKLEINGKPLAVKVPLIHKFSDRVEGEIIRPVVVTPELVVSANKSNLIFTNKDVQTLKLSFRSFGEGSGKVKVEAKGWNIDPSTFTAQNGDVELKISPKEGVANATLKISIDGKELSSLYEIDYSHIEKRIVLEPVSPKLVRLDLKRQGSSIGYIPGAGDKVAEAIEYMGYKVDVLDETMIKENDLSQYQAIVAGIRAYNTESWLPSVKTQLMEYVKNGGNYIVQYNTRSRDLLSLDIGPYPFEISRERVTEEDAEVRFLLKEHPLLNVPNKLTKHDFNHWVQERGLYFASSWADDYVTPLGWNDKGEPSRNGGLLIGHYGKGAFVYTGISFFRELPAGVPGAYRLLANVLSYSNNGSNE